VTDPVTPAGYGEVLALIARDVRDTRLRALSAAGAEVIALNWRIGALILERQDRQGWGAGLSIVCRKIYRPSSRGWRGCRRRICSTCGRSPRAWPAPGNFPTACPWP